MPVAVTNSMIHSSRRTEPTIIRPNSRVEPEATARDSDGSRTTPSGKPITPSGICMTVQAML